MNDSIDSKDGQIPELTTQEYFPRETTDISEIPDLISATTLNDSPAKDRPAKHSINSALEPPSLETQSVVSPDREKITPEKIFLEHVPRIYLLAKRILGHDADAEDVTQDVLLQVVRKLDSFRGESDIKTWLHRITVNASLVFRRKQSRQNALPIGDVLEQFDDDGRHKNQPRVWQLPPDHPVLTQEMKEKLEEAIAELPDGYRETLVLADIEELPNAEIAEMLNISLAATKSRLHRARLMLRDRLSHYFEGGIQ